MKFFVLLCGFSALLAVPAFAETASLAALASKEVQSVDTTKPVDLSSATGGQTAKTALPEKTAKSVVCKERNDGVLICS